MDDQDDYPLYEEDDVPETAPHRRLVTDLDVALRAYFPAGFVSGNVCLYWEPGNTLEYRAPDVFVVNERLAEPARRVYQHWKQPPVAFALEVVSRSTLQHDVGPDDQVRTGEWRTESMREESIHPARPQTRYASCFTSHGIARVPSHRCGPWNT